MNAIREDLAAAATSVTGVKVHPRYVQTTEPGSGFVRLEGSTRSQNSFGYVDTWHVVVILPASYEAAEEWLETHQDQLVEAIDPLSYVLEITPSSLILPSGSKVHAVVIESVRGRE